MKINDAEETFVLVLKLYPIAQSSEIVSQMYATGGLCSAEYSFGHFFADEALIYSAHAIQKIIDKIIHWPKDRTEEAHIHQDQKNHKTILFKHGQEGMSTRGQYAVQNLAPIQWGERQ